jgi:hypothetical protein
MVIGPPCLGDAVTFGLASTNVLTQVTTIREPRPAAEEATVRSILLVASLVVAPLVGITQAVAQSPTPPIEIGYEAPVGHRQPTVLGTTQAASAKDDRSASDVRADEAVRRSERELRDKLIICRSC